MLETEYNEAEVLEIARLNAERRGKKLGREEFVSLLKKLVPGSDEYERALKCRRGRTGRALPQVRDSGRRK